MTNFFDVSIPDIDTAIVDADSIIYFIGHASDMLDGDKKFALKLLDHHISDIYDNTCCRNIELYLGTDTNYRDKIATMKKYKSNRDSSNRPIYYKALRHRMIKDYGAHLCEQQEAEDVVGIRSFEFNNFDDFIICRVDKDLAMIPGVHYNYRTKKVEIIDKYQALRNFYCQLVTGDSTDNIPGLYHHLLIDGEEELAHKFRYSRYKKKLIEELNNCIDEKSMYEVVFSVYDSYNQISKHGLNRIIETGQLLWIRRSVGELWVPPTERDFNYIDNDSREI